MKTSRRTKLKMWADLILLAALALLEWRRPFFTAWWRS